MPSAPSHPALIDGSALPPGTGASPGTPAPLPLLQWADSGGGGQAWWHSERGAAPPGRVRLGDDTLPADTAFALAQQGHALLWRGDFQNARHLLQALVRRVDRPRQRQQRRHGGSGPGAAAPAAAATATAPADAFHRHRMAQAQRARILGALLIELDADYGIPLRRAPDWRAACTEAWGPAQAAAAAQATASATGSPPLGHIASLRELLGLVGAHEWRKKGVPVPALGPGPDGSVQRIHPHYGVFSPVRGEYLALVARAPLPAALQTVPLAMDIGTGTGVLAALLAQRGVPQVLATDTDPRALACAADNLQRLRLQGRVQVLQADLFAPGRAALLVCNPPWLPARPTSPLERAVYDDGGRMLAGFLAGAAAHLAPGGEAWLVLSDLAERLGLREPGQLQQLIAAGGLRVLGRLDARPQHPKALDPQDPLHAARAGETTTLWRLAAAGA